MHAATVDLATTEAHRARVLVVGPSGAGKTTLATRLLLDGADVQGDESVLVRRGESLAVPRALHLKPGAARVLPELAAVIPELPVVGEVTVLDPARVGRPVNLRLAPVEHVVVLADGRSGDVTCTPHRRRCGARGAAHPARSRSPRRRAAHGVEECFRRRDGVGARPPAHSRSARRDGRGFARRDRVVSRRLASGTERTGRHG